MKSWWRSSLAAFRVPENKGPSIAAVVVVVLAALLIFFSGWVRTAWVERLDAIFGMTTVALAALLFLVGARTKWTASLPLRLTVDYQVVLDKSGRTAPFMVVLDVPLTGAADIRAFSQQIAAQMSQRMGVPAPFNRSVPFKPFNQIGQAQLVHDPAADADQEWFIRHTATFYVEGPEVRAPEEKEGFWSVAGDTLRWGPKGEVNTKGLPPVQNLGLLVWWNNLADRPLNDEAWLCPRHCAAAHAQIEAISAGTSVCLVRTGDQLSFVGSLTEGVTMIDPKKSPSGTDDCGCFWDLAYSHAVAQDKAPNASSG